MIKLFASDLDGTLLNEKHESDEGIEQTIQNIIESGRIFAAATGRSAAMVNFHDLTDKVYIICMNGSVILGQNRELLHFSTISKEALRDFMERFSHLHIEYLSPDKTYVLQPEEEYVKDMQEHSRMLANPSQWIDRFMRSMRSSITYSQKIEDILRQDICKINCRMMENEDTHDLVAYLEEHKDVFVNAPSGKGLFEITDAKTNKATAVRWLAEYLNVTKDEVAVYGDGGNDLDMLAMFPHSYAPAAAQERAKTAASAVIGPYEEYSVARHMEKLLLLQK